MKPLAIKNIGVQENGLELILKIWSFFVDAKNEKITVVYNMETISPNGTVVYCQEKTFERTGTAFNNLKESDIGIEICGMLQADLDLFPNLEQKL